MTEKGNESVLCLSGYTQLSSPESRTSRLSSIPSANCTSYNRVWYADFAETTFVNYVRILEIHLGGKKMGNKVIAASIHASF